MPPTLAAIQGSLTELRKEVAAILARLKKEPKPRIGTVPEPLSPPPGVTGAVSAPARDTAPFDRPAVATMETESAPPIGTAAKPPLPPPPVTLHFPIIPFALAAPGATPRHKFELDGLRAGTQKVNPDMDPRLQVAVARAGAGMSRQAFFSAAPGEIPVVAKVSDVQAWEALSEVQPGVTLGRSEEGHMLVTARVPVRRLEAVRAQPFVISLKPSRPVRPVLSATTQETGCRPELLPTGTNPRGGAGVIVGIVDFGCDFAHDNFRRADGSSRVEIIWSQGAATQPDPAVKYGRVFRRPEIEAALRAPDPYQTLGYGPPLEQPSEPQGAHGTHVMDIAAGNGRGSGVPGCAPEADLIFVDLLANDVPSTGSGAVGVSIGDSVQLLEALRFVFDQAGERPCVINLSLGTNGGPHDGRTLVEQGLDALLRDAPNRAVVIAASNSYADGIHAAGSVPPDGTHDLLWDIPAGAGPSGGAELELWMPAANRLAVELIASDGTALQVVEPGSNLSLKDEGQVVVYFANRLSDPGNGDNTIGIFIAGVFPEGRWTVRLHDRSKNGAAVPFHVWIERYDSAQASFPEPRDNTHTLGSISCGHETIVVGSYDAHKPTLPLSYFSSAGPSRDGRQKPEISAPGHGVVAARSRTRTGTVTKSGTSMAAPAVTGIIALLFAEARKLGISLSIAQTRQLLIAGCRMNPPIGSEWDARYGHGRVSAAILSGLAAVAAPAPRPPSPVTPAAVVSTPAPAAVASTPATAAARNN